MPEPYTWPTELDNAPYLLTLVGSFWSDTYGGNDLVEGLLYAKAQEQLQAHLDLLDLFASISRFKIPVFHIENWTGLILKESELNSLNIPKFDGTYKFDGTINYDMPVNSPLFAWPAPAGFVGVNVIMNRIANPTSTYTIGLDTFTADGAVWFRTNPFTDPEVPITEVFENGVVVDRVVYMWAYRGAYDWALTYRQFGYILGIKLASSRQYRSYVNAVYDGLVEGTTARCVEDMMSAVCDVPLALGTETVKYILTDSNGLWVITDENAYGFSANANPIVAVGDVVQAGDLLTDALLFHDFGQGKVPDDIKALVVGRGLLSDDFERELVFENKDYPLTVSENVEGYTKVSMVIGGWSNDVDKFWDDTHAKGITTNDTLAMRLDTRTNKVGQPTAIALPSTMNPMKFLIQNVLRGNAFAIVVRPEAFGPEALGLHTARLLRKLVPPQTICIVIVRFDYSGDVIVMDGPGSEEAPGYTEDVGVFSGNEIDETMDPADYVTEDIRVYQIGGYCS